MKRAGRLVPLLLALACASEPAWDLAEVESRHPALAGLEAHQLSDVRPYYLPLGDRLTLFLCRWPDGAEIPVTLPDNADDDERRALETAIRTWNTAGLGFRFRVVEELSEPRGVTIELIENMLAYAANTVAECAVDPTGLTGDADPLPAEIRFASIQLAKQDPRLVGSALHELGHALGFQGHPRRGNTVMRTRAQYVREAGERAKRGELLRDSALDALYAVPSGTVLARKALPAGRTRPIDRLLAQGLRAHWQGPFARVGDAEGRIAWRDRRGDTLAVVLTNLRLALDDPARLELTPSPAAEAVLARLP